MTASVIIPTLNGASRITTLLKALEMQQQKPIEIIVVVDGSTDGTVERLQSLPSDLKLKIIETPQGGRAKARNAGGRVAEGDVLVFYDDDMEPATDSISKHVNFHQSYNGIVSGYQKDVACAASPDIRKYKAHIAESWFNKYSPGISKLEPSQLFFTSANCSIQRQLFDTLGGFDERLTDAEDFDLAVRAQEAGHSVFFDKSNVAIHHDNITAAKYIERQRAYARAHAGLRQLHPNRFVNQIPVNIFKRVFYSLFAFPIWVIGIDRGWFLSLPRGLRYRFYSIVIYSLSQLYSNIKL